MPDLITNHTHPLVATRIVNTEIHRAALRKSATTVCDTGDVSVDGQRVRTLTVRDAHGVIAYTETRFETESGVTTCQMLAHFYDRDGQDDAYAASVSFRCKREDDGSLSAMEPASVAAFARKCAEMAELTAAIIPRAKKETR